MFNIDRVYVSQSVCHQSLLLAYLYLIKVLLHYLVPFFPLSYSSIYLMLYIVLCKLVIILHTHTHTYTHIQVHACTYTCTCVDVHIHVLVSVYTNEIAPASDVRQNDVHF